MNKAFVTILLISAACSQAVADVAKTHIPVSGLRIERDGSRLNLSMTLDVRPLAPSKDGEYTVTPVIKAADGSDSLMLEPFLISGRNLYYEHLRNNDLGATPMYRSGRKETVEYSESVPMEPWIETARVSLDVEERSCCDYTSWQIPLVRLSKPEYKPVFNFVTPVGDSIKVGELKRRAYVNFPVNRTEMYPEYMNNPIELKKIFNTIDSVKNDPDITITSIFIKGFASPEGSYSNNVRLAKGRTATLTAYVESLYHFGSGFIKTAYEPEDWEGLREYVEKGEFVHHQQILDLIDSDMEPDAKDRKLRVDFPSEYAYILANIYPWLRHSDYRIEYRIKSFTSLDEILRVLRTEPSKLSVGEFYRAAQSMPVGSDEYNAVFETAVRYYPDNEAANLNAANAAMGRGQYAAARSYLDRAGDGAEAVYARGVLAALEENWTLAEELFARAARLKVADAPAALEAVKLMNSSKGGLLVSPISE